jgi:MFS family permease
MLTKIGIFGSAENVIDDPNFRALLLANVMSTLGTALVSPLLSTLTEPFGVSGTQIGLIITAFSAPAILCIPLAGLLADRIGRKPLLVGGLIVYGISGSAVALTTDFQIVLVLRFVQGCGYSLVLPTIVASVGDLYEGVTEATAQGLRFATSGVSQMLFPLIAGLLVIFAWQYPFVLYAIAIPVSVLVYLWFDEPDQSDDIDSESSGGQTRLREHLTRPPVAALLVARGLPEFLFIGFLTFNSMIVVHVLSYSSREAGLVVAACSLMYAIAATQTGRLTAIFQDRFPLMILGTAGMGAGLLVVAFSPSLFILVAGVMVFAVAYGVLITLYRSTITAIGPTEVRGSLVSIGESIGRIFATLVPIIVGALVAIGEPRLGYKSAIRSMIFVIGTGGTVMGFGCLFLIRSMNNQI